MALHPRLGGSLTVALLLVAALGVGSDQAAMADTGQEEDCPASGDVACGVAGGFISGRVLDDAGVPVPLGRAEIYNDNADFLAAYDTDASGNYATAWMPAGDYYVLLYNGDDETFFDYFPEWYPDTPLYLGDLANLVTISNGEVGGIDAHLDLGFEDMWDSPFVDDIVWMQYAGITKGCGNDRYCPAGSVTRAQMAAFLVRALGLVDNGGGDLFIDDNGSIFEGDIDRLAAAGITRGCNPPTNNLFCPDTRVTRAQMAAFLVRALGYVDDGGGNLFTDDDGSIFESDIDRLGTAGVTRGCNPPTNTRYCPDTTVSRGQMAAFLHRALGGVLYPASVPEPGSQPLEAVAAGDRPFVRGD